MVDCRDSQQPPRPRAIPQRHGGQSESPNGRVEYSWSSTHHREPGQAPETQRRRIEELEGQLDRVPRRTRTASGAQAHRPPRTPPRPTPPREHKPADKPRHDPATGRQVRGGGGASTRESGRSTPSSASSGASAHGGATVRTGARTHTRLTTRRQQLLHHTSGRAWSARQHRHQRQRHHTQKGQIRVPASGGGGVRRAAATVEQQMFSVVISGKGHRVPAPPRFVTAAGQTGGPQRSDRQGGPSGAGLTGHAPSVARAAHASSPTSLTPRAATQHLDAHHHRPGGPDTHSSLTESAEFDPQQQRCGKVTGHAPKGAFKYMCLVPARLALYYSVTLVTADHRVRLQPRGAVRVQQ
ncbi:unnamed protein product [Arctogadus glacialis]